MAEMRSPIVRGTLDRVVIETLDDMAPLHGHGSAALGVDCRLLQPKVRG